MVIEQLTYAEVIRRYDGEHALFYLDPPYVGCEKDYGHGFTPDDFALLADQLGTIAGRFLLSINDTPLARDLFARFRIEEVRTTYTIAGVGNSQRAAELVISNL